MGKHRVIHVGDTNYRSTSQKNLIGRLDHDRAPIF